MPLAFGDADGLGERKQTRREILLAEMKKVVPWTSLLAQIETDPGDRRLKARCPEHPLGAGGRRLRGVHR